MKNNNYGKQFSKEYLPQKKWTEEKAIKLGEDLIKWLKEKNENMFFNEFLVLENDYYHELITYLCKKYKSFFTLINRAKEIQELKLQKYGVLDKLNAAMTKFVLINVHDWRDKSEVKTDSNIIINDNLNKINRIDFTE